jgi:hypothetical protein
LKSPLLIIVFNAALTTRSNKYLNVFYTQISVSNYASLAVVRKHFTIDYGVAGFFEKNWLAVASTKFMTVLVWSKNWVSSMELDPRKINQEVNMVAKHMRRGSALGLTLSFFPAVHSHEYNSRVECRRG